ncbi:unnamed protein product [Agarophyton chilense]
MPISSRPRRPLRKRLRFDDLADEEPESSSEGTASSDSADASPPPDFAADADDEEGYISPVQETTPPKPHARRPSRLAKPRSFLDAVRPYVEPLSKDAVKLSQLTMTEISAGEAHRGPLVVTEADRTEAEAARATAAIIADGDSDEHVDDREQMMPQEQTRPFSLQNRIRCHKSYHSRSEYDLSPETHSESGSEAQTADSPSASPHAVRFSKPCLTGGCGVDHRASLEYEPEENRSPPRMVLRLVRSDKMESKNRSVLSDSEAGENYLADIPQSVFQEPSSIADHSPNHNVTVSLNDRLSGLGSGTSCTQRCSTMKNVNNRQFQTGSEPSVRATESPLQRTALGPGFRENENRVISPVPVLNAHLHVESFINHPTSTQIMQQNDCSTNITKHRYSNPNETGPNALYHVIDVIDLSQNDSPDVSTCRSRINTVQAQTEVSYSTNTRRNTSLTPQRMDSFQVLDYIDLCNDDDEGRGQKEVPIQSQPIVVDLCSDDDHA